MAKSDNQKLKLLYLSRILVEQTDEDHVMSVPEMITQLERYEIHAERKSIYSDLVILQNFGLDVQSRRTNPPGWYVGQREFQLPELKLLVDVVQASRFITSRKSAGLIRKLRKLGSKHQSEQLNRQVFVADRAKSMNESIYYNVDKLHHALLLKKSITFQYFDYDIYHKQVMRNDGRLYNASPFGLVWNNENYYLVAYDNKAQQVRHYRVDKMKSICVTTLALAGEEKRAKFDLAHYGERHFGMFSGEETRVTLRGTLAMANVIIDRFGQDVIMVPADGDAFHVTLPVVLSPQFYGWLFGLGGGVKLVAPAQAVAEYRTQIARTLAEYQEIM